MIIRRLPLESLRGGRWIKLICGASYQYLPAIRDMALVYSLAGVDCIDVAADPAVVQVIRQVFRAIAAAPREVGSVAGANYKTPDEFPLLMVSFNDGEDPHFRKAVIDPKKCLSGCSQPCASICPAGAISSAGGLLGVMGEQCYGCGRCLPVCPVQAPVQAIEAHSQVRPFETIMPHLARDIDAIEIHTQVGHYEQFMALWAKVLPYLSDLSLISISCQNHDTVTDYLWQLYEGMHNTGLRPAAMPLIWQTDGRPMSGDLGKGTTHATLRFAQKVLQSGPPGFVQLAGGTNDHTVRKLAQLNFPVGVGSGSRNLPSTKAPLSGSRPVFGGIAYGSFARCLIEPYLGVDYPIELAGEPIRGAPLPFDAASTPVPKAASSQLVQAVHTARSLVTPLKCLHQSDSIPAAL